MRYTNEARHKVSSSTCIHLFSFFVCSFLFCIHFFFLKFRRASGFDFITWREDAGNEQQKGERESETVKDDVKMLKKNKLGTQRQVQVNIGTKSTLFLLLIHHHHHHHQHHQV